ncbi:uncharacterized protein LOC142582172 isoform X3 [Dermacentor variabilis]|uniref:uncharacterized protein LOC142582172 isoform X3 n=1 Tax=Dermacentor variabilis TaxID=34621 RepID=UPI003F5C3A20
MDHTGCFEFLNASPAVSVLVNSMVSGVPETQVGSGLRLLRLDVPSVARRGEPVWLNCSYDLERDQLYSIKWYKNNVEIYRYLPSETPRVKVYNMPGIHIDVSRSNISDLYLNDTDLNSEGKYRCEVSAESPSFQTERAQQEMLMYVLPLEDPVIRGLRSQYQIGDPVNLTCSYGPSKPNASLTWYINDRKVPTGSEEVVENGHFLDAEGLWHAHSRVTFVAQPSHFWHGAMEVRCASHAALPYFVSSEELTVRDYGRTLDVSGTRLLRVLPVQRPRRSRHAAPQLPPGRAALQQGRAAPQVRLAAAARVHGCQRAACAHQRQAPQLGPAGVLR